MEQGRRPFELNKQREVFRESVPTARAVDLGPHPFDFDEGPDGEGVYLKPRHRCRAWPNFDMIAKDSVYRFYTGRWWRVDGGDHNAKFLRTEFDHRSDGPVPYSPTNPPEGRGK